MNNQSNLKNVLTLEPVTSISSGMRLDKYLSTHLPYLSRTRLKMLIKSGMVNNISSSNKQDITDPSQKVKIGDSFSVEEPEAAPATPQPENIPLTIIYEDDSLIVIDKQAGLVVHPAAGNGDGTLVNALLFHCGESLSGIGGIIRPGIVHRIDKDTSGLMIAAKSDKAHKLLSAQFANHSIERTYHAIVKGRPIPSEGRIEGHIARHPQARKKMAVSLMGKGKWAATHYRVLEVFGVGPQTPASIVECRLETGRTHQVRVHMSHIGHPLLGDQTYGKPLSKSSFKNKDFWKALNTFKRQALHAVTLGFEHPETGERMVFKSESPPDMQKILSILRKA